MMDSVEAEARAREFITQRHSRVKRIFFRTMYRKENLWVLQGEVKFKRAFFFTVNRSFEFRINIDTGEMVFYGENPLSQLEAKRKAISLDIHFFSFFAACLGLATTLGGFLFLQNKIKGESE